MTAIAGRWQLRIRTPIGAIDAEVEFVESADGITGTAIGAGERTDLREITVTVAPAGEVVTWRQRITKPLRLDLGYQVTVVGDSLQGHSRAGRLPRSEVTGRRLPPP